MKKIILLPILLLLFCSQTQAQTDLSNLNFGGGNYYGGVYAIVKAPDGSTYVGGDFTEVSYYSGGGAKITAATGAYNINDAKIVGWVYAVVSIPVSLGGGWYIGGDFTTVGGVTRNNLAKINADGSLNSSFNPNLSSPVYALALDSSGNLYVGGLFDNVGGVTRNNLAKINADGTLNNSFNPNMNDVVSALALDSSGNLYVGGFFTTVGGVTRNYLAKINADGTLNSSFNPNMNNTVNTLALDSSGNLYVGGDFTTVNYISRYRLAKINADGSLNSGFIPIMNATVITLALDAAGNLYVGGDFTTVGGVARNNFAKINADGSLNSSFNPYIYGGSVYALVLDSLSNLYIGGNFITADGEYHKYLAKINADGTINSSFNPNMNKGIRALAIDTSGNLYVGGDFTGVGVVQRKHLAKINADGSLNSNFNPNTDDVVNDLAIDPSGNLYVGGVFAHVGISPDWVERRRLAKFNADGSLNSSFNPNLNYGGVNTLALDPSGNLYVGGVFTTVGSVTRNHLAKINADGTLNNSFNPNIGNNVNALALDPSGNLFIGGYFTTVGGVTRNRLAKINADGSLNSSFDPNIGTLDYSYHVNSIALDPSGNLYVGGGFNTVGGVGHPNLAKINADGSLNSNFNPNIQYGGGSTDNVHVNALVLDPSGNLYVGGGFSTVDGVTRNHLAKINADGSLNSSFNPNIKAPLDGLVIALALDSSGNLYVGGIFAKNYAVFNGVSLGNTVFNNDKDNAATYYPNPTTGILNINYSKEISSVSVVNLLGQTVLTQTTSGMAAQLDLSALTDGTYIVKMVSEGKTQTFKVIKGL